MTKEHKQFITLRADGKTFDYIAKKLNKAKSTLIRPFKTQVQLKFNKKRG